MTRRRYRLGRCYRCGYVWRLRRIVPRICARCKSKYFDVPKLRVPSYGGGLGIAELIGPKRTAVLRLAKMYGARNVRVFGSVARKAASARSDIDILVDRTRRFRPLELSGALSKLLGRRVDLIPEDSLFWLVQPQTVAEAVPL
jgi:predicted nucleotidyltransferase